ncbi:MAG: hypothetical protein ABJF88_07355 [Rhodothermales bacterium]
MTNSNPEDQPASDASAASAGAIRVVANVLGVLAGVLFLTAFGIDFTRHGEWNMPYLAFGILFLLFPFLVKRRSGS